MNDLEEKASATSSGKATASVILGGVSICGALSIGFLILPFAITGLVLGFMSMKSGKKGLAKAGLIMSVIAVVLSILVTIGLSQMNAKMEQRRQGSGTQEDPYTFQLFDGLLLDGKTVEQLIQEAEATEQLILESEPEGESEWKRTTGEDE